MSAVQNIDAVHTEIARLCRLAAEHVERRAEADAAVRTAGTVLVALAGFKALYAAFDFIEIKVGQHEAAWLSRSWAGLSDGDGRTWG